MASPPTAVVPLPVIIAKRPIPLAAERVTAPVISDSRIASPIKRGVPGAVDREVLIPIDRYVSVSIDRYVIAIAKLIRVLKTINVRVPCPVHCDVPFTIRVEIPRPVHRDVSFTIRVEISCPVHRDIPR